MCDCVDTIDEKIAGHNSALVTTFPMSGSIPKVVIRTDKLYSAVRGKPVCVVAIYCPFCGVKYPAVEARAQ